MEPLTFTKIAVLSLFLLSLFLYLRSRKERKDASKLLMHVRMTNLRSTTDEPVYFRLVDDSTEKSFRVEAVSLDSFGRYVYRTVKSFAYDPEDAEGREFAGREAEELIDKLSE